MGIETMKQFRETFERLNAASHDQVDYFAGHKKIEGYYEEQTTGTMFGCDRLWKSENLFGTIQLGYNPNRKRVFLFANMKTSRYDTVPSRYQKEMKEYQRKSLLKGDNENRAYVSRRWSMATVLIEKKEPKPWTERSVKTYLSRANTEAVKKNLPFFSVSEEKEQLSRLHQGRKEIQQEIRSLSQAGKEQALGNRVREREEQIRGLRRRAVEELTEENLLEAILIRKASASKHFLRRLNYAYDFQKTDIEAYYREKSKQLKKLPNQETENEDRPEDEDQ